MFELRYVWAQKDMFSYPSEYSVNLKLYLSIIPSMRMSMWDVNVGVWIWNLESIHMGLGPSSSLAPSCHLLAELW